MAIAFDRSLRALRANRLRQTSRGVAVGATLAVLWSAWLGIAKVGVVKVADNGRIEVERSSFAVDAPVAGRITAVHGRLGQEVKAGDVLFELDAKDLRLKLEQEKARLSAIHASSAALVKEIEAKEKATTEQRQAAAAQGEEGRARIREAESRATFREGEKKRSETLRANGLLSAADADMRHAEAEQERAAADTVRTGTGRIAAELRVEESEQKAAIARLRREAADLEGERTMVDASILQIEHAIDQRTIRAPVDGHLGEVAPFQVGGVLKEGERLAVVVPRGRLRAVGQFAPADALGRIAPGQSADIRLEGFSWTHYGIVRGVVASVASEPRDGWIRVEIDVDAASAPAIPLVHGLPATVSVEVERVSPAKLVLRAAGALGAPATKPR